MFGARPCARMYSALVRRFTFELNPAAPHSSARRFCIATEAVHETRHSPTADLSDRSSAPPKSGAEMKRRRPGGSGAATQTQRTRNVKREFPIFEGHDPDMFGTLSDDHRQGAELLPDDDDDLVEYTKLKRMSDKKYENDIKQLVLERKIKEALNLFFEIQKAYEVKPTHVMFTLLIGGCGRVGYTKMAFKLYRMMRDRGLEPTPATLTGLFNSCAESPFPEMGLDKAHKLYEQIKLKNWVPSNLTYHAMIKAFGKCGDLDMAFRVMDEMADAKHAITTETFAFLLMACISNKEAGFSLGLKVMRTMLWKKIRPSVYCYNLFLRTVRDCGVGPPEMFRELLESVQSGKTKRIAGKQGRAKADNVLRIEARMCPAETARLTQTEGDASEKVFETTREAEALPFDEPQRTATSTSLATLPNLLSPSFEHTGEIVGLGEVTDPFHRLLMVGGVKGMMDHFRDMSVRPDSKTITMLLDCIPNNFDAEAELIAEADKIGAKLDVDFFNMLIKRRAFRREKETAKDTLSMMTARGLHPDVVTFGVLALTVHTKKEGSEFLKTMQATGLTVNEETWGTLVCNACFKGNFWFLLDLMGYAKRENILVSAAALRAIDKAIDRTRRALLRKERGKEVNFLSSAMESGFRQFCLVYEDWLKEVRVDTPRHPWEQYEPENLKKSAAELKAAAVALTTEQT
ncbi:pentatricopeptide repeat-containing protein 1, mitochondrial isoform X1 [Rhipicephalus sanguineus]|uniref:pentatricopeptide repeat-containing protein 1, mitochondrial isoform X1 n=1 Tax=Rhipicephalus sanguineus TaxID=34632 RepID=UPI0020C53FE9|nr:pentatricopeptide repeat-containing protein 1, mitochondrial isoform X1 [Rhipicephalus sanguineus]XP_049274035.1 pentatricopeptide repeat-containing protein 1, mitochondrial isoform X1 [Rhipicephalus sanguineus]